MRQYCIQYENSCGISQCCANFHYPAINDQIGNSCFLKSTRSKQNNGYTESFDNARNAKRQSNLMLKETIENLSKLYNKMVAPKVEETRPMDREYLEQEAFREKQQGVNIFDFIHDAEEERRQKNQSKRKTKSKKRKISKRATRSRSRSRSRGRKGRKHQRRKVSKSKNKKKGENEMQPPKIPFGGLQRCVDKEDPIPPIRYCQTGVQKQPMHFIDNCNVGYSSNLLNGNCNVLTNIDHYIPSKCGHRVTFEDQHPHCAIYSPHSDCSTSTISTPQHCESLGDILARVARQKNYAKGFYQNLACPETACDYSQTQNRNCYQCCR